MDAEILGQFNDEDDDDNDDNEEVSREVVVSGFVEFPHPVRVTAEVTDKARGGGMRDFRLFTVETIVVEVSFVSVLPW